MAQPLKLEDFVWTTGAFCQRNRIPHDAALLIKQYPSPYEVVNLPQALQCFGLNNSLKQSSIAQLSNASLPRLAILNPASQTTIQSASITESDNESNPAPATDQQADTQQSTPTHGIALILRRNDLPLLVLQPNQAAPITVSIEDFTKQITGDFLRVRNHSLIGTDDNVNLFSNAMNDDEWGIAAENGLRERRGKGWINRGLCPNILATLF